MVLIAAVANIVNVHDSKATYLLMRILKEMCSGVKVILADKGYKGELINSCKKEIRICHSSSYQYILRNKDSGLLKRNGL